MLKKLLSIFKLVIPHRVDRLSYFFNNLQVVLVGGIALCVLFGIEVMKSKLNSIVTVIAYFVIALLIITYILSIIAMIRNQIARLHDVNLSGWWLIVIKFLCIFVYLWLNVNYVSYISAAFLLFWPGTKGSNKFGESV